MDSRLCGLVERPVYGTKAGKWRCHGCKRDEPGQFQDDSDGLWRFETPSGWRWLDLGFRSAPRHPNGAENNHLHGERRLFCGDCWHQISTFAMLLISKSQ